MSYIKTPFQKNIKIKSQILISQTQSQALEIRHSAVAILSKTSSFQTQSKALKIMHLPIVNLLKVLIS